MASDHLSRADDLDGQAIWLRITAAALKEAASRKLSDEANRNGSARRTPSRRGRNPKTPKPATGRTKHASPRLPDGIIREELPKFGLPRAGDPTGQKELILGALWITRGSSWSPQELEGELRRTGLVVMKHNMGIVFLRRMAAADPPLVVKLGEGRGTRYELAPRIVPKEGG